MPASAVKLQLSQRFHFHPAPPLSQPHPSLPRSQEESYAAAFVVKVHVLVVTDTWFSQYYLYSISKLDVLLASQSQIQLVIHDCTYHASLLCGVLATIYRML